MKNKKSDPQEDYNQIKKVVNLLDLYNIITHWEAISDNISIPKTKAEYLKRVKLLKQIREMKKENNSDSIIELDNIISLGIKRYARTHKKINP